jgi:hypothetical protein
MQRAITIEEICRRLKPVLGKKVDQIYLKFTMSESREEREKIQAMLNVLYEKHLNTTLLHETILLEPPQKEIIEGEYPLGQVVYAGKDIGVFGLREKDWPRHVCVVGMSGSGKTTFAYQILGNFILHKKPFLIFDWKKSFRPLMNMDKDIMCFTVGNESISNLFRININKPPKGVNPKQWVSMLCDIIVESFFASYGVHKVLREVMDQAFRDFGVYKGSDNYPTWNQIKDRLEDKAEDAHGRGRESEWLESALRIANSLTFGGFGDALNSKEKYGFDINDLLNQKVIFELHALGTAEKKFFCEFLLSYIYFMKKFNQEGYSDDFKNAIVVDEAHHIFLKDKPNFIKESITEMIYRELREYGISLICLDQHISKLSEAVSGNSATTIAFQQVLPQDVFTMSGLMQMKDEQKYFSMLPVGQAIVRLVERHYEPFQIKVPFIKAKNKMILDAEISTRMHKMVTFHKRKKLFKDGCNEKNIKKLMDNLDGTYKVAGSDTNPEDINKFAEEMLEKQNPEMLPRVTIDLTQSHQKMLKVIKTHKSLGTTQTYKKMELSSRKCDAIKNDLIGQNLIETEEVKNNKGWVKKLKLTDRGLKIVQNTLVIRKKLASIQS